MLLMMKKRRKEGKETFGKALFSFLFPLVYTVLWFVFVFCFCFLFVSQLVRNWPQSEWPQSH